MEATSTTDAMRPAVRNLANRRCFALFAAAALLCSCAKEPQVDPTGVTRDMSTAEVVELLGKPNTIKPAGEDRLIYLYRKPNEKISVFFVGGKVKTIEHIRSEPH